MSVREVIDYLLENGPATRQQIFEELDNASSTTSSNLQKMTKWKAYYRFEKKQVTGDDGHDKVIYNAEKRDKPKKKRGLF